MSLTKAEKAASLRFLQDILEKDKKDNLSGVPTGSYDEWFPSSSAVDLMTMKKWQYILRVRKLDRDTLTGYCGISGYMKRMVL